MYAYWDSLLECMGLLFVWLFVWNLLMFGWWFVCDSLGACVGRLAAWLGWLVCLCCFLCFVLRVSFVASCVGYLSVGRSHCRVFL